MIACSAWSATWWAAARSRCTTRAAESTPAGASPDRPTTGAAAARPSASVGLGSVGDAASGEPRLIPARISIVTLGARDLGALRGFYVDLGWRLAVDLEDFAAFETRGAVLTLYPLKMLAADAGVPAGAPAEGLRGFTLAINVDRPEEVDRTIEEVRRAGGRVTKEPVQAEWGGRSAYFADPEGNSWEVAWVPPDSRTAAALARALEVDAGR